jgi:hypothetical protein
LRSTGTSTPVVRRSTVQAMKWLRSAPLKSASMVCPPLSAVHLKA